jgi:hypothetical protein
MCHAFYVLCLQSCVFQIGCPLGHENNRCFACLLLPAECAAGWGSHIIGWTDAEFLPAAAPSCAILIVNAANSNNCRCVRCPNGFTSRGGLLNTTEAACRKSSNPNPSPSPGSAQTAYIRIQIAALAAANPCAAAQRNRLAAALAAGIESRHRGVSDVKVAVSSCRATTAAQMAQVSLSRILRTIKLFQAW